MTVQSDCPIWKLLPISFHIFKIILFHDFWVDYQFDPILIPRRLKFWKQIKKCFFEENKQTIKNFLFFRKLTQIPVISRVLELNSHTNSQRYIGFNFGLTTNYFRLKSEILNHLLSKVEIWGFAQFDFASSNPQKIIILGDIIALGRWKHIYFI